MSLLGPLLLLALSAPGEAALVSAEKAFHELEFDKAERLFKKALEQPATIGERRRAWKGLGLSQAFQGEARDARASFEKLLLLDPSSTVDRDMGPKISRPFEEAKDALQGKRNHLRLEREADGSLVATLQEDVALATSLTVHARAGGVRGYTVKTATAGAPLSVPFPPEVEVEAWAEGKDAAGGVVCLSGPEATPRRFPPRAPKAVVSAVDEARRLSEGSGAVEDDDEEGTSRWPLILVGVGVVVGAGLAVGFAASQPPALNLPPADRTGQLPFH
ncbi:MAG: tetratricopeptide repeat protein [Myxococcaceae bacterium]